MFQWAKWHTHKPQYILCLNQEQNNPWKVPKISESQMHLKRSSCSLCQINPVIWRPSSNPLNVCLSAGREAVLITRMQNELAAARAAILPSARDGETRPALWKLAGSPGKDISHCLRSLWVFLLLVKVQQWFCVGMHGHFFIYRLFSGLTAGRLCW